MPRYSKKHYDDAAKIFARLNTKFNNTPGGVRMSTELLIGEAMNEFAKLFKADSPGFDIFKFIDASRRVLKEGE